MESTLDRAAEAMEKSGGKKMANDVESIKSSFAQLRADVMDLLSNAFGLGRHSADYAKENAVDAVQSLKSRLSDLKDRGAEQVHAVEKKIGDNPLPAALIAFGVGFVLAKLLTRR